VPRLTPEHAQLEITREATLTADRFGTEWKIFDHRADYFEQQFLDWVAPLQPRDFADRVVLEGGCGKGRHTQLIARWGCKAIVAVDLGDAVDVAFQQTRHLENVHVVQADITRPPTPRVFDLAFSVGVLHHLPVPVDGFRALHSRVVPGGRVSIWVYGYEHNEWIVRFVNPLRRHVTSRIPETSLYWASLPPAALLKLMLALYRSKRMARRLPYGAYLNYISRFPLREVHHIMFDQLVTPVAFYLREDEVRAWFDTDELGEVAMEWHNENSWRATAEVIAGAASGASSETA
jgi:SAM-dependent methyltransferase